MRIYNRLLCITFCVLALCAGFFNFSVQAQSAAPELPSVKSPQPPLSPVPPSVTPPSVQAPVFNFSGTVSRSSAAAKNTASQNGVQSLSADDIAALSSLFGSRGSPLSLQTLGSAFSPALTQTSAGTDSGSALAPAHPGTAALLQAVLEKLDNLQKTVEAQGAKAGTQQIGTNTDPVQYGRVLRFAAGSYNILPTCTAIFISKPESDGSFLLTGDRTYRSSAGVHSETFYLLFQAASGSDSIFNAAFSLSQQTENPQSPLYTLPQNTPLQAVRMGNLVSLRTNTESTYMDLLLDIRFGDRKEKP